MHRAETPGPVGIHVELGLATRDELGQRTSDTAGAAETIERETGGHVQARYSRHRPDQRVGVRCHRVRVADQLDDPRLMEKGETAGRGGEQRALALPAS